MKQTAGIFLVDKSFDLLICHPTNHPKDFWSIPKGEIDQNESWSVAAYRELLEETGIDLKNSQYVSKIFTLPPIVYKSGKKRLHSMVIQLTRSIRIDELKCTSTFKYNNGNEAPEIDDYKVLPIDEAVKKLHESQRRAIEPYLPISPKFHTVEVDDLVFLNHDYHVDSNDTFSYTNGPELIESGWYRVAAKNWTSVELYSNKSINSIPVPWENIKE